MHRWSQIFWGIAIASPVIILAPSAYAQTAMDPQALPDTEAPIETTETTAVSLTFTCQLIDDIPMTVAQMPEATVPMIRWDAAAIAIAPETTQQAECEASAQRFQTAYNDGILSYITTGHMDGRLVVCAAAAVSDRCLSKLLELQATQRPRVALQQVLQIRLPTEGPISDTGPRPYVSLSRYLQGDY